MTTLARRTRRPGGLSATAVIAVLTVLALTLQLVTPLPARAAASVPGADQVYDQAGRLVTVVDGDGRVARYTYDAGGNITSIGRSTAPAAGIIDVNPRGAAPGRTVTVLGRGFGTTPAANAVTFNGVAATVSAAAADRLTVVVPPAATTGPVRVRPAGGGDFLSPQPFTVPPKPPTLGGFSPAIGAAGTAVTVTGTGFQTTAVNDTVAIGASRASVSSPTATALTATVPAGVGSGKVTVATPYGAVTSATDFFVAPAPFTPADVGATGRVTIGGPGVATTLAAGRIGLLLFDGTAGQRATMDTSGGNLGGGGYVTVLKPDGTTLASTYLSADGVFLDAFTLPATGTYTLLLDPDGTNAGSTTVALGDVPPDTTGPIAAGGPPVTVPITAPGQNGIRTFLATAGQRITLDIAANTVAGGYVNVVAPNGTTLSSAYVGGATAYIDTTTLPTAGTYSLVVDPYQKNTGRLDLQLRTVPADSAGTMKAGGPPATVTITAPGQNGRRTFPGVTGQRVMLDVTADTIPYAVVTVLRPDGGYVTSTSVSSSSPTAFVDTMTLPVDGTYSIDVDPSQANTGSLALQLKNVPADSTGAIAAGGPAKTVTINAPGQNAVRTFTGAVGQRVTLDVTANTVPGAYITLNKPDGSYLTSTYVSGATTYLDATTLPVAGTYSIVVDPYQKNTGSMTLQLGNVPADTTGAIAVNGAAVTVTITKQGQNGVRTFTGAAGQRITLDVTANTVPGTYVTLSKPDGSYLTSLYASGATAYLDTTTLPVAGTYSILVDPYQKNTGSLALKLSGVPADTTGTVTVGGPTVTVPITKQGQNGVRTFTGAAGQSVAVDISANTIPGTYVTLQKPDGSYLTSTYLSGSTGGISGVVLPVAGTYSLVVDPYQAGTGSLGLAVRNAPAGAGPPAPAARPTAVRDRPPSERVDAPPPRPAEPGLVAPRAAESLPTGFAPTGPASWAPPPGDPATASTGRAASPWEKVPEYEAVSGVTALSGRVLGLDGRPLANVSMSVGEVRTRTDASGRFVLVRLPAGHAELVIDGVTANAGSTRYGRFEAGVDITAGRTNRLPYTVWMPELDTAREVDLAVPTTRETVITTPAIPGLEVHLPPGTTIKDEQGRPVRRIGITAIPIDRTPFPLPLLGVEVPIYFTVQPGGAYVYPEGARIIYPNYTHEAPGRRVEFYNYDPDGRGWYAYGFGHVTADGKQVVPDPGVEVYAFTGAMFNAGSLPPTTAPPPGGCSAAGDPVDCATGIFTDTETDLSVHDDLMPIDIIRTYRSGDGDSRSFGIGSSLPYDMFLWSAQQYQEVDLILPDGGRVHYVRTSPGTGYSDAAFASTNTPTAFYASTLTRNNLRGGWELRMKDGSAMFFPQYTPVTEIRDRFGNQLTITRNSSRQIVQITAPSGRWVTFTHDAAGRISGLTDVAGRTVSYAYDAAGRLTSVTDAAGRVRTFTYDAEHRMLTRTEPRGNRHVANVYDAAGRVTTQTLADGSTWKFAYTLDGTGRITKTVVTDPRGVKSSDTFDAAGYASAHVEAVGTPDARTTGYTRTPDGRFVDGVTDPLGRVTRLTYDARGNVTSSTRLAGTADAVTTSAVFDPTNNQVTELTDPLGHRWAATYTAAGAPATATDPIGRRTTLASDSQGRPTSVTDPLGRTSTVTYQLGDVTGATDPLGRSTRRHLDSAGRPVATADAFGNVSLTTVDAVDQVTAGADPLGDTDRITYDANGSVVTVTDPRGGITRYAYDTRDRVTTRTDPLGRVERYTYDKASHVTGHTDRRGVVGTFGYDPLGRITSAAYGGSITDTFAYDAVSRLTSAASSPAAVAGTISRTYDPLDRIVTESSAQGTVTSAYDKAGRRTSMTVAGQPAVAYSYDDADQLTALTRGGDTVGFTLDAAGRRTGTTLPNGVGTTAAYDPADQVTGLTYTKGATTLGTLTYGYDAAGRRQRVGGSYAGVELPTAVPTATYDAANQLTSWGSATVTSDAEGNITGDGTDTFTFDARNQLSAISGTAAASFAYDPLGRRTRRTVGATATSYLHDGLNPVQELAGTTPTATLLTGPDLDEFYGRYEGATSTFALTDVQGSTVAMTGPAGVTTRYGYQPYGATTTSGPASTNPYQFTGRENDGTGLYHYRARYYDPALHRFISEDPLGFAAGDGTNLYSYARNSPTNYVDPTGRFVAALPAGLLLGGAAASALLVVGAVLAVGYLGYLGYQWWNQHHSQATGADDGEAPPGDATPAATPGETQCPHPIPDDPTESPGPGWEWRGKPPAGGDKGAWHNPETGESLHPDLNHGPPYGPHWDWTDTAGKGWRVYPGGRAIPK